MQFILNCMFETGHWAQIKLLICSTTEFSRGLGGFNETEME